MGLLENLVAGLVKQSTGLDTRRLTRRIGGRNLMMLGGAALAGMTGAEKGGSFLGGDHRRWTGSTPAEPPPPPLPASVGGAEPPPPPPPPNAPVPEKDAAALGETVPPELLFPLVRTLVAAALADGELASEERAAVEEHLEGSGLTPDQVARVRKDLVLPPTPAEIAGLVEEPAARDALYRAAVVVTKADGAISAEEEAWLDRLAGALAIPAERAAELEAEVLAPGVER